MRKFITTEAKRRIFDKMWRQYDNARKAPKSILSEEWDKVMTLRARIEDNIVLAHEGEDLDVNA